jgi:hypothetical protein
VLGYAQKQRIKIICHPFAVKKQQTKDGLEGKMNRENDPVSSNKRNGQSESLEKTFSKIVDLVAGADILLRGRKALVSGKEEKNV